MTEFREDAGISLHRDANGKVLGGPALPRKDWCEADPVLREAREEMRAKQSYESLCVLYVAMTRAKKALYCLTARGRHDKNSGNWLEKNFPGDGDRREQGDPQWFNEFPISNLQTPDTLPSSSPALQASALSPLFLPRGGPDAIPARFSLAKAPCGNATAATHLDLPLEKITAEPVAV